MSSGIVAITTTHTVSSTTKRVRGFIDTEELCTDCSSKIKTIKTPAQSDSICENMITVYGISVLSAIGIFLVIELFRGIVQ